ncbi:alpha-L-fucosidase [Paludicola sp. MB14-C6]|uniref:alpha-L-fucosidase n=1 Tax=Paludihabitans sp. MB14-C6 TaxID=3070656 RepID=UPI0027DDDB8A|nr:alpha-L-fucosidase [Paludicola sp. MB14-C6]WMJ23005.1 alpha-L-fucosidase [Paludicola sp. MB14-C6]
MSEVVLVDGVHNYSNAQDYVPPKSKEVQEHLKWFTGLKLGLMMHFAPESQLGICESWPLSNGDADWSREDIDWTDDMDEFKQQYINANKTFNPVKFRPDEWAKLAKDCGFKYLLFTTKHHDGFCMYDTKTTTYKITDPSCPFHTHKYADMVKHLYEAFRKEGLAISTYFSKPDWHSNYYWCDQFPEAETRNVNYDIEKHPDIWNKFVEYTHEQITELTSNYGKVDVLWLDGGWVEPNNLHQDIRLGEIVEKIRSTTQPHLIVCDRTVGGEYENIITPEQTVPDAIIDVPWESNITLGDGFSYRYCDHYKTGRTLVHKLLDVVSKGGNLALNIAPQPDGKLPKNGVDSLRQLGSWLKVNGDGIYETKAYKNTTDKNVVYTQKNGVVYAFYLFDEVPSFFRTVYLTIDKPVKRIELLRNHQQIPFTQNGSTVEIHTHDINMMEAKYSDCFQLFFE